jgi:hypothetical protein
VIKAPRGLVVRRVPLIAVQPARKSPPAAMQAIAEAPSGNARPGSVEQDVPRKTDKRSNEALGLVCPGAQPSPSSRWDSWY